MDILFIRELRLDTEIGVYDWEKNVKQPISLDIEVNTTTQRAAETDDLVHALDYQTIADRISEFLTSRHFNLVETVAEEIAGILMKEFGVTWLRLRVSKLSAIKTAKDVGVLIERGVKS